MTSGFRLVSDTWPTRYSLDPPTNPWYPTPGEWNIPRLELQYPRPRGVLIQNLFTSVGLGVPSGLFSSGVDDAVPRSVDPRTAPHPRPPSRLLGLSSSVDSVGVTSLHSHRGGPETPSPLVYRVKIFLTRDRPSSYPTPSARLDTGRSARGRVERA